MLSKRKRFSRAFWLKSNVSGPKDHVFKSKSEVRFSGQRPYQNIVFQVVEKDTDRL
jgi:hypothetical protein